MSKTSFPSLSGQLLVAMPSLADPNFERSVTLLCQHDESGAVGLVINRPASFDFDRVLEQLDLKRGAADIEVPVFVGGPVQPERGFVLHRAGGPDWDSSHAIGARWSITTSRDILAALADGSGPQPALLVLGYAGWTAGQLEQELGENAWLTAAATEQILFEIDPGQRWQAATQSLGFDSHQLSGHAGHA